ncbi:MAG: DUF2398 family protein [Eubacteriales bacterium]|nr:DUF2398 family protein [Eubacteriales bacterium]
MSELSTLMNRIWISKSDPEFYEIKSFVRKNKEELSSLMKRFAWQIITEPNIIYVKKYNNSIQSLKDQGIQEFKAKLDYLNLMIIFMYMTRPSGSVIFTLEELLEYMKIVITEEEIETDYKSRHFTYSLYRVLSYMEETNLIERMDGKLKDLLDNEQQTPGILYKNTGLYHYFLGKENQDSSLSKEQTLYQKLYANTVVEITEKEYEYLKKNTAKIEEDFNQITDESIELVFGLNYAYINHNEGNHFPNENSKKDWMLLRVLKKLKEANQTFLSKELFFRLLEKVRTEDSIYWTQEMIRWGKRSYESYCLSQLSNKNFIEETEESIHIHPAVFEINL